MSAGAIRNVFIVGCGYLGARVAALERAAGAAVAALARTADAADRLRALGIAPVDGDLDRPAALGRPPFAGNDLYYFVSPPARGVTDPRVTACLSVLTEGNRPRRIVLLSTTGVYGDCQGAWVNEDRPPHPRADRARRRLDAETTLRGWSAKTGVPVVILRVAGLYGPGRLPVARLQSGEPVLREEESPWSNRIHVDDLAAACVAAMRRGQPGAVYIATDGHPSTLTDYFNRVADTLGIARPPPVSMAEARERLSEGLLSYLAESKRLDNRRLRQELGVELRYPDLASGLPSCKPG